jgi:uncharacterized protein YndB with AHSA1/START domain
MTTSISAPAANTQMLIRRPARPVFEAFIDPAITSRFWFSRGSGKLEVGKRVTWEWEMYGFSTRVDVKAIDPNRRILVEWNVPDDPSLIEWTFEPRGEDRTFVRIKNWDFKGNADAVVQQALDSTGGFTFVLAAAKALLEHDIELNIVADHDPDSLVAGWSTGRQV